MFDRVLVANRGEIALRVVRACRDLGVETVAVHSSDDSDSEVVRLADRAVKIGPAAAQHSYLSAAAIVEAAHSTGSQAIHPGYGFLSEDPDFAEICADNGLVFIGPPPGLMADLGDKATARRLMTEVGLPLLPGSTSTVDTVEDAQALVHRIGVPVIIKASAGGGGRGMTVVRDPRDLAAAYATTRSTAQAVFGDSRVYVERFCEHARHVEIQVLADSYGNVVHLGERDCSIQRRHQKLIEESPAPGLDPELTREMAEAAALAAKQLGYVGAGTFEFLVDSGRFYFMEINCRVQVEHAVTEQVSGRDIVAEQIRIAAGEPLSFAQSDVVLDGCAIEVRINAEDPAREFAPTPGRIDDLRLPAGPFVRVDTAARKGGKVSTYYDSLLAKVVCWGPDRDVAIRRLQRALSEVVVDGIRMSTTTGLLQTVLDLPEFRRGEHTTRFLEGYLAH